LGHNGVSSNTTGLGKNLRKLIVEKAGKLLPQIMPWIDIESLATAELSSEDPAFRFENALSSSGGGGWPALEPGPQTIRLHFQIPIRVGQRRVEFQEFEIERPQEFAIFAEFTVRLNEK